MSGPPKQLTPKQVKFAQLLVYGVEGSPITKTEAAKLAGYATPNPEGTRLTNPNKFPMNLAHFYHSRITLASSQPQSSPVCSRLRTHAPGAPIQCPDGCAAHDHQ